LEKEVDVLEERETEGIYLRGQEIDCDHSRTALRVFCFLMEAVIQMLLELVLRVSLDLKFHTSDY